MSDTSSRLFTSPLELFVMLVLLVCLVCTLLSRRPSKEKEADNYIDKVLCTLRYIQKTIGIIQCNRILVAEGTAVQMPDLYIAKLNHVFCLLSNNTQRKDIRLHFASPDEEEIHEFLRNRNIDVLKVDDTQSHIHLHSSHILIDPTIERDEEEDVSIIGRLGDIFKPADEEEQVSMIIGVNEALELEKRAINESESEYEDYRDVNHAIPF